MFRSLKQNRTNSRIRNRVRPGIESLENKSLMTTSVLEIAVPITGEAPLVSQMDAAVEEAENLTDYSLKLAPNGTDQKSVASFTEIGSVGNEVVLNVDVDALNQAWTDMNERNLEGVANYCGRYSGEVMAHFWFDRRGIQPNSPEANNFRQALKELLNGPNEATAAEFIKQHNEITKGIVVPKLGATTILNAVNGLTAAQKANLLEVTKTLP